MISNILTWSFIFSCFRPSFALGLGLGLLAWLFAYGLKLIFSLFEEIL